MEFVNVAIAKEGLRSAFSCAKRAADPTNEFAACRRHCGNTETCLIDRPNGAIHLHEETISGLTKLIRHALDLPPHGESIAMLLMDARDQLTETQRSLSEATGQMKKEST